MRKWNCKGKAMVYVKFKKNVSKCSKYPKGKCAQTSAT